MSDLNPVITMVAVLLFMFVAAYLIKHANSERVTKGCSSLTLLAFIPAALLFVIGFMFGVSFWESRVDGLPGGLMLAAGYLVVYFAVVSATGLIVSAAAGVGMVVGRFRKFFAPPKK